MDVACLAERTLRLVVSLCGMCTFSQVRHPMVPCGLRSRWDRYLNIDSARLDHIRKQGFTCGSTLDVIDDLPVGSIRVSFGYMSALRDADALVYVQCSIATAYVCV